MNEKICTKCHISQPTINYSKKKQSKDNLETKCRLCVKEYNDNYRKKNKEYFKKYSREYYLNNKIDIQQSKKEHYDNNCEDIKLRSKKYYTNNREVIKPKLRKYRNDNKERLNEYNKNYQKHKRDTDPLFKLKGNVRGMVHRILKSKNMVKKTKTTDIIGCTFEEFKVYIESKWVDWMNWDNYGKYNGEENHGWDIDHIVPMSSAINEGDIIKLNHHTNLQPLCSYTNRVIKKDTHE